MARDIVAFMYGNNRFNEFIKRVAMGLRLYYPYNLHIMKKYRDAGEKEPFIRDAREFYIQNEGRVDVIFKLLADEKSKGTYRKLVNMRQYYRKEDIPEYNYYDQYFPDDLPMFSKKWEGNEVLVDCGAFNGDVTQKMAEVVHNYKKIYAFEPDIGNIRQLRKRRQKIKNLEIVEEACSDHSGKIFFTMEEASGGSHVSAEKGDKRTIEIPCITIDEVIGDERCDFIKMDIEGAEWDALHGAANTIKKNKPKLAISIYHSNEDMVRLPEYIHELVPEYKLYVRAHTMGIAETILYAM